MHRNDLKTPCFIVKDDVLRNNLISFQKKIRQVYPKGIVGYSFKTNSLPHILALAKECGCYAEVVSDTEYRLAEQVGFAPEKIIYNGPIKSKEVFEKAYCGQAIINIDSDRELQWLSEMSKDRVPRGIGLRVNFDLESMLPGQTTTGINGGRFGFNLENGKLHKAIEYCHDIAGVKVSGLHMHVSSKTKSVDVYRKIAETACQIIECEKLDIEYLDIGGGFFGGDDGGVAYQKYVNAIHEVLNRYGIDNIRLIVEPGASVVATAVDYMTSVIEYKDTNYTRFVITDGSRLHIDPFFQKSRHCHSIITNSDEKRDEQIVCGFTCMENDRIIKLEDEYELQTGDKIIYHTEGSYTMCFNPLFIEYLPYVYAEERGEYTIVRDKWGVEEYLQKNYYPGAK